MRPSLTVLVTSAGRRVELLNCFRAAAGALDVDLRLLACDAAPELSAACAAADAAFAVPMADDPAYIEAILQICARNAVVLLVPTIDPELMPLSQARDRFAAVGCTVSISEPRLIAISGDKLDTADFLAAHGVASPRTRTLEAAVAEPCDWSWPSFAKPRYGSSGRGARAVDSVAELDLATEPMIVQELLRGVEFTINMFFDRSGSMRCAVPHERLAIRAGEVEKGMTRASPVLIELARRLAAILPGPRGALCFQAMVDAGGNARVFEINARFGGGYPIADRAGAPFTRWLLEEALGRPSTATDDWREGVLMLRYDAAIFAGA